MIFNVFSSYFVGKPNLQKKLVSKIEEVGTENKTKNSTDKQQSQKKGTIIDKKI